MDESKHAQRELDSERAKREELETQVAESKTKVAQVEAAERSAREMLDNAAARHAELECRASAAVNELEAARNVARQVKLRLSESSMLTEKVLESGRRFSEELRRRAQLWDAALDSGQFDALDEGCNLSEPTFAQVTHRLEETPSKSPSRVHGVTRTAPVGDAAVTANDGGMAVGPRQAAETMEEARQAPALASIVVLDVDAHDTPPGATAATMTGAPTSPMQFAARAEATLAEGLPAATLMAALPIDGDNAALAATAADAESLGHHLSQPLTHTVDGSAYANAGVSTVLSLEFVDEEPAAKRPRWSD